MSTWKRLAIEFFPKHNRGWNAFQRPQMTIYQVFFVLKGEAVEYIRSENDGELERIFKFVDWCFSQRKRAPDIWNAAATAFLEHLADDDERAEIIPRWVKPDIFKAMRTEFQKRRERDGVGKFQNLLEKYNSINDTDFV